MDDAVDTVQLEAPLIALTEAAFQGVRVPILLNRTVTIAGSPKLPERPSLFLFAKHKVELQPGVTLTFLNLAIQYIVSDFPTRPCTNDTSAPLMDRCWFPRRDFYQDVAANGAETTAMGGTVPNNMTIHIYNTSILCQEVRAAGSSGSGA
ncbi:hypothetical protein HXX76_009507 [Chlamydomonas incerta]|uniref:Uncharacterized protein n=1 Tax=Chlamydomonas incerta TaxID=51695 RepID=A0A835SX04_CHLIN|nr:hypothetical protein HXX76_009507 [Chlamydomonas incerta]|eukprot:KAG2431493.1 hypothetical protein HXX76_009507 [Chlamydomonas incerta]